MDGLLLTGVAFASSTVTAMVGLGGGLLLIAVMPGFVPAAALVPVHGIVQLASNLTRAAFAADRIDYRLVRPYALGAGIGAALGSRVVPLVGAGRVPLVLGLFVLLATWLPRRTTGAGRPAAFVVLGGVQTFLSLFVGAAGPLSPPLLLGAGLTRDRLVATHAAQMTWMHFLKALTFGVLGFALTPYAGVLLGMIAGVTLGSFVGTRLRRRVSPDRFRQVLRVVLTLLALRMIFGWGLA